MTATRHVLEVPADAAGRLDTYLARTLDLSRTRVQKLIAQGQVRVNGRVARKSEGVEPGQSVEVVVPPPEEVDILPEELELDVVYEDEDLLVVNKAAGMVVHPAPGHRRGTLVNALLHHVQDLSGVGGRLRPGIVHRLDRDTSGLLLVAKNDAAHHALADALRRREIRRGYVAAVWGHLPEEVMTFDAPIARDPRDRQRMAVVEGGRRAVTHVRVREHWLRADLLEIALETGRTHQIRVHLAHCGHPVLGDAVYGAHWERGMGGPDRAWAMELARRVPRQFLHAEKLAFAHPRTGEEMVFTVPLPADLSAVVDWVKEMIDGAGAGEESA
ncbi:MAG: RluA family pseudouridine synthase [Gemmatimonadota bacterium]